MMLKHRDPARRDALKSLRLTLGSDAPRSRRRVLTVTVFGNGIGLGDRLANQATTPSLHDVRRCMWWFGARHTVVKRAWYHHNCSLERLGCPSAGWLRGVNKLFTAR